MASLGQIAEAAGVRPPKSSRSTRIGAQTPGAAAGIASGGPTGILPRILEPAPVSGSASSSSTVGLAAPSAAGLAERSASATDLYQRAIRDANIRGRPQQRESDPGALSLELFAICPHADATVFPSCSPPYCPINLDAARRQKQRACVATRAAGVFLQRVLPGSGSGSCRLYASQSAPGSVRPCCSFFASDPRSKSTG